MNKHNLGFIAHLAVCVGNAVLSVTTAKRHFLMQVNDLGGIEPPKSFRNAEDSVPYGRV